MTRVTHYLLDDLFSVRSVSPSVMALWPARGLREKDGADKYALGSCPVPQRVARLHFSRLSPVRILDVFGKGKSSPLRR